MEAESGVIRPLTVAGAAQVRRPLCEFAPLLPVELLRVNHAASTNVQILQPIVWPNLTITDYVENTPNRPNRPNR